MTSPGTLYGVGVGPGDPELLTLKGLRVLTTVPVVYVPVARAGADSYARSIVAQHLDPSRQRIVELVFAMRGGPAAQAARWDEHARVIAEQLRQGDAAFVTEGDPMLYSTFVHIHRSLMRQLPDATVEIVPGVSSVQAAAAAAQVPLGDKDERIAILPASYEGDHLRPTLEQFDTVVLMKVASCFDRVLATLEDLNLTEHATFVARCGRPDQAVVRDVRSLEGESIDYFSLLIIRKESADRG